MLQSFIVYIIAGLLMFILGNISYLSSNQTIFKKQNLSLWKADLVLLCLVFATLAGLRWNVGVDHMQYLDNYIKVKEFGFDRFENEKGFHFLTLFFARNFHFFYYFAFIAFLQLFLIYATFRNERYLYPFLGILILFGPEFLNWMNGMRQAISVSIFVFSIKFIKEKKLLKYLILILLASTIHKSIFLLTPVYFIAQFDYFKKRLITYILVLVSLLLGNTQFWISSLNNFASILEIIGYTSYSSSIDLYIDDIQLRNIGPRRIVMIFIPLITIWYSMKLKKTFKNTYFLICYNFSISGLLLYNLLGNTNHIFLRPVQYLNIFNVATSAYLLVYFLNFKNKKLIFSILILLMLSYLPISVIVDSGLGVKDFSNYKFFWNYYR